MASRVIREISLATVWQLSRPSSLLVTVVASLLGLASAAGCGIQPDWAAALAALLLAVMFHAGVNVLQTYHAARQGMASNPSDDPFGAGHGTPLRDAAIHGCPYLFDIHCVYATGYVHTKTENKAVAVNGTRLSAVIGSSVIFGSVHPLSGTQN